MARTSDIPDIELIDRLTDVFRKHGFEGASLTLIAEATGLKRASLYHRFPGGKAEMAEAVLTRADDWLISHALSPLEGSGEPADRLCIMTTALSEFYGAGRHSCLLDAFSLGGENSDIRKHVRASTNAWIEALAAVAREIGIEEADAHARAQDVVASIQGTLVLSRATGDLTAFQRALLKIPDVLLSV